MKDTSNQKLNNDNNTNNNIIKYIINNNISICITLLNTSNKVLVNKQYETHKQS